MSAVTLTADLIALVGNDPAPRGPEFGKATPLGLAVIVVLLAATFLLVRSMNSHIKNLPESFDDEEPGQGDEAGGTDSAGTGGPDTGAADNGPDPDGSGHITTDSGRDRTD